MRKQTEKHSDDDINDGLRKKTCESENELMENNYKNIYPEFENIVPTRKNFLRRGDGLARFRMTMEDFKSLPEIYKEKRVKTHLNKKPKTYKSIKNKRQDENCGFSQRETLAKPSNNVKPKCISKQLSLKSNKEIPVSSNNIYCKVKEKKHFFPDTLKSFKETSDYPFHFENIFKKERQTQLKKLESPAISDLGDFETKKDEKELKVFEILEQKINDDSFCSSSSFVNKLMDQSITSIHQKSNEENMSLKKNIPSSDFFSINPMEKNVLDEMNASPDCEKNNSSSNKLEPIENTESNLKQSDDKNNSFQCVKDLPSFSNDSNFNEVKEKSTGSNQKPIISNQKRLLQEYVKNFKNLKSKIKDNTVSQFEFTENEVNNDKSKKLIDQNKIAMKLKRKGLQDNVKPLMNWDFPPRKKTIKRVVKKPAAKHFKTEKTKFSNKEQTDKVVLNSALLRERLEELEKEILIFRKENSKFEKLLKECQEEKHKLMKERKEFEKQMEEERKAFDIKMTEGYKKLQKDRNVFETYCKQNNCRPNRREREEIMQLKKDLEKINSLVSTKESRWAACQARLRNQIRSLEKENSELKNENENLKKLSSKRIAYNSDKKLNAKIIRAVNSELEKYKPSIGKTKLSSCSCSARESVSLKSRQSLETALRRVNSAPNIKKQFILDNSDDSSNQHSRKIFCSISTDSGIETNRFDNKTLPESANPKDGGRFSNFDQKGTFLTLSL